MLLNNRVKINLYEETLAPCSFVEKQLVSIEEPLEIIYLYLPDFTIHKLLNILDQRVIAPILFQDLPYVFH